MALFLRWVSLTGTRNHVQTLAEEAGPARPEEFARSLHVLMKGSIISAAEGDTQAAARARQMAGWLIEHRQPHRRAALP